MVSNKEDIVIIGFGGHAKSVADSILKTDEFNIVGYTDVHDCHCDFKYLGTDEALEDIYKSGVHNAFIGIGYMGKSRIRDSLIDQAKKTGFHFPIITDPSATIALDVTIGEGTYVGKNTVINADAQIGGFCIINTGSIVEHENIVGDYSHVAVGAVLCGNVVLGDHSLIGAGATVIQGITVGNNSIVGAGSIVNHDVPHDCTAVGAPARVVSHRSSEAWKSE